MNLELKLNSLANVQTEMSDDCTRTLPFYTVWRESSNWELEFDNYMNDR